MNLNKLFQANSVAIVGASEKPGPGRNVTRSCSASPIWERTYLVNPTKTSIGDKPCYPDLASLPETVDCVIICTPKKVCPSILEQAGKCGVPAAIVYASGFSEEATDEGNALERELKEIAGKYDIALLGPNCNGLTNNVDHLYFTMPGIVMDEGRPSGIGVVSQSGFLCSQMTIPAYMSISYGVSVGNGCVVTLEDILEYLVEDARTNVIAIYLEGVKDGMRFIRVLKKACEYQKPIVVLKSGRSERGAKSASSHTGSIAGSFAACKNVLDKYNVVLVDSLQELMYASMAMNILKKHGFPRPGKVASVNLSGAENVLCADSSAAFGIVHAELTEQTKTRLAAVLPSFATPANPLDMTTNLFNKTDETVEILSAMSDNPEVSLITVGAEVDDAPVPTVVSLLDAVFEGKKRGCLKPVFVMSLVEATRDIAWRRRLEEAGVPILAPGELGYKLLQNIIRYVSYRPDEHDLAAVEIPRTHSASRVTLSEYESKEVLSECGVTMPWNAIIHNEAELEKELEHVEYPVVIKINSADIPHKSDAGGVVLNIPDLASAKTAFRTVIKNCAAYKPDAKLDGVQVSRMYPKGMELLIGATNDAQMGPMIMVGLGGVYVEVFKDFCMSPAPVSPTEALNMLKSLKCYRMLAGYRGGPAYDVQALVDMIVRVSRFAASRAGDLCELDLNPVMVYEKGAGVVVADALLTLYQGD